MDWREHILRSKSIDSSTDFKFNLYTERSQIKYLKEQFNLIELPFELEELYKETNGVNEYFNNVYSGEWIWSIQRVVETNTEFRNNEDFKDLYMSFEQFLFFSDAGNGDLFGFITLNGKFSRKDVFVWNHEDDSRTWVAPNLQTFIKWWLDGTITV